MTETYIHGTEPSEQLRLTTLNRLTNQRFLDFLDVRPSMRVLEVGSGLGLLAAGVAAAADGVTVVGLERSPDQIRAAVKATSVTYVEGDAHDLDFPGGSFDLVYARYLLEHVARPEQVLREMRRVARSGGRVAVCENDISLLRLDPPCPAFEQVWSSFARYQTTLGGDALIGRRLYRLFRAAGFQSIELSVQPEIHWFGSDGYRAWIQNLIGNIESARRGLDSARADEAIGELISLAGNPLGSCTFVWNRAAAIKRES